MVNMNLKFIFIDLTILAFFLNFFMIPLFLSDLFDCPKTLAILDITIGFTLTVISTH